MTPIPSKMNNFSHSFALLLGIILFLVSIKQRANTEFLSHYRKRGNRKYCLNNERTILQFSFFPYCDLLTGWRMFCGTIPIYMVNTQSCSYQLILSMFQQKGWKCLLPRYLAWCFSSRKFHKDFRFYRYLAHIENIYSSILMPKAIVLGI